MGSVPLLECVWPCGRDGALFERCGLVGGSVTLWRDVALWEGVRPCWKGRGLVEGDVVSSASLEVGTEGGPDQGHAKLLRK